MCLLFCSWFYVFFNSIPESHVWEIYRQDDSAYAYLLNKVTGEVRKYNRNFPSYKMENWRDRGKEYLIMQDVISIPLKEK